MVVDSSFVVCFVHVSVVPAIVVLSSVILLSIVESSGNDTGFDMLSEKVSF